MSFFVFIGIIGTIGLLAYSIYRLADKELYWLATLVTILLLVFIFYSSTHFDFILQFKVNI